MPGCYAADCKRQRRDKRIAIAAVGIIGLFFVAYTMGLVTLPKVGPTPGATGQSVNFKVSAQLWGGTYPTYGTMSFYDSSGNNWGGGAFSTTTSGTLTTGTISTGYTYQMYFNGTTGWAPASWSVPVPAVTGLSQPVNYYQSIVAPNGGPFTIYPYASTFSIQLVDTAGGTFSQAAIKTTSSAAGVMANLTTPAKSTSVPDTLSLTISVGAYSTLYPSYMNPAYPASGQVGGYFFLVTNSTNVYAYSGCTVVPLWSGTTPWQGIIIPVPQVIAGATATSVTVNFGVYWPTSQHPQVYAYMVYNTNAQQLMNAKSLTVSAPNGYTIASNTLIGSSNAQHTYALWAVP